MWGEIDVSQCTLSSMQGRRCWLRMRGEGGIGAWVSCAGVGCGSVVQQGKGGQTLEWRDAVFWLDEFFIYLKYTQTSLLASTLIPYFWKSIRIQCFLSFSTEIYPKAKWNDHQPGYGWGEQGPQAEPVPAFGKLTLFFSHLIFKIRGHFELGIIIHSICFYTKLWF